jgi:glycosyltransferase involved in cell wall biosynthesis
MSDKILVIFFYYNRPELVKYGLESLKEHNYDNWEVAFIDDGSEIPADNTIKEMFGEPNKFTIYKTNDTAEIKMKRNGINGSMMGKYAHDAILKSDADYVITLCDDDALYQGYFKNLVEFFRNNPDKNYVYSHIKPYDPTVEPPREPLALKPHSLNKTGKIHPFYALDMSQVSFRRRAYVDDGISFPYPYTVNLDAEMFLVMQKHWGDVTFSGFIGQYKAIYTDSLSHRMGQVLGKMQEPSYIFNVKVK